jgi:hypothetical protein
MEAVQGDSAGTSMKLDRPDRRSVAPRGRSA